MQLEKLAPIIFLALSALIFIYSGEAVVNMEKAELFNPMYMVMSAASAGSLFLTFFCLLSLHRNAEKRLKEKGKVTVQP